MKGSRVAEYSVGLALLISASLVPRATAIGTAFTYQGQLQQGGSPATGACDFQFTPPRAWAPSFAVPCTPLGIRKDAFANAHPLVVELDKPAEERGRYLYPVEAGMPASLSVDRAKQAAAQAQ